MKNEFSDALAVIVLVVAVSKTALEVILIAVLALTVMAAIAIIRVIDRKLDKIEKTLDVPRCCCCCKQNHEAMEPQPEQPEQPEKPGQPGQPEQPDQQEKPEQLEKPKQPTTSTEIGKNIQLPVVSAKKKKVPVYYIKVFKTNQDDQQPLYGPDPLSVSEGSDLRIECTTDDTENIERNQYQFYLMFPNTQPIPLYQYGTRSFIDLTDCLKNSTGTYSCEIKSDKYTQKIKIENQTNIHRGRYPEGLGP